MEDKLNLHTIFRVIVPGYVFILILLTLNVLPQDGNFVSLYVFVGLPLGYILEVLNRSLLEYVFFENEWQNDRKYIIASGKKREEDDQKEEDKFSEADNFYYAASIDYVMFKNKHLKTMQEHIRFINSRMYSLSSIALSILLSTICYFAMLGMELKKTHKIICIENMTLLMKTQEIFTLFFWFAIFIIATAMFFKFKRRVFLWRTLIVDKNINSLEIE